MAQNTIKRKDETKQTKAGLMSEKSSAKKPKKVNKSNAELDNLPKTSKSGTGKSGGNEGLH